MSNFFNFPQNPTKINQDITHERILFKNEKSSSGKIQIRFSHPEKRPSFYSTPGKKFRILTI